MVKADLVNRAARKAGVTKTQAAVAVDALFEAIKKALLREERIELRGFGVFEVKAKKTGVGRNPKTGDEMPIPPGKAIRFKPGKEIRVL
jgi:DNA-binding protein HU-beta